MMFEVAIIPLPALLGISLILVGGREIQRFAVRGGHAMVWLGKFGFTVNQVFLIMAVIRFVSQCAYLKHCQRKLELYHHNLETGIGLATSEVEDRLKSGLWRAERNLWIVVCGLGLWIIYIRASQVLTRIWMRIDQLSQNSSKSSPNTPANVNYVETALEDTATSVQSSAALKRRKKQN